MRKYLIFSSLMASCALFGAEETLKEIVVTGAASPTSNQSIETLVSKTKPLSVISEQQLQRSVGKSVLEMISQEPGVSMVNDGMDSGQPVIRGMSAGDYRVPTFVDGLRWKGRPVLEYTVFDPDQFERMEIVRGPASSLFGTDSFGGVVNLVSKRATGDVFGDFALSDTYLSSNFSSANRGIQSRVQLGLVGHGLDFLLGLNYRYGSDYKTPDGKV
ncbi:MAG: TonB-dependent receptor plug domain-containing protein, partial [Campylobacter sp.]